MIYEGNKPYIIFNGTELHQPNCLDVCKDVFSYTKILFEYLDHDVGVHKGYYDNLFKNNSYGHITEFIDSGSYDTIYITGHSAGACLSVIATYLLANKYPHINFKTTLYGTIKQGNYQFKKYFDKLPNVDIISFVNNKDIVPILPVYYKYYGVTDHIHLCNDGKCESMKNAYLFKNHSIVDHDKLNYLKNLFKIFIDV